MSIPTDRPAFHSAAIRCPALLALNVNKVPLALKVSIEIPDAAFTNMPFRLAGPLSGTVKVSQSGNELEVGTGGIYQIAVSITAEATADPDEEQPYLSAYIMVNGEPMFKDTATFFRIMNINRPWKQATG